MKRRILWATLAAMTVALSLALATSAVFGQAPETITVLLKERSGSGQSGTAIVTDLGGGKTQVVVSISKGTKTAELNHYHFPGSCKELPGVRYSLTNLDADQKGTTVLNVPFADLLTGNFAINTHEKGAPAIYTTCGDVPARVGAAGGTLPYAGNLVTVTVPQGAVTGNVDIIYTGLSGQGATTPTLALVGDVVPAPAPTGTAFGSVVFSLSRSPAGAFSRLANITVKYSAADVTAGGGNYNNVNLYAYDAGFKEWNRLDSAIRDVANNTLTTQQTTLGTLALAITGAVQPTPAAVATPRPPGTGDVAPSSGALLGLVGVGALLVLGGGYLFLRRPRRSGT